MIVFGKEQQALAKGYTAGTHRSRRPLDTIQAYTPLLPKMGITRVADVTGLDTIGLPVYVAIRPNSRSLSTAQGKGLDHASAEASAMMEAIESWHGDRARGELCYESYQELRRTSHVIDAARCPQRMGAQFRPDTPHYWMRGWDTVTERLIWVPYELVHTNFVDAVGHEMTFLASSNGLASGNHLLEAAVHGLCEVVERDATELWKLRNQAERAATRLDLSTVDDPVCRATIELITTAGVCVAVWDQTSDTGVPSYQAIIWEDSDRPTWRRLGPCGGYGCHLSPDVALMRALTEAVQSRLTIISGSRDDCFYYHYASFGNQETTDIAVQHTNGDDPAAPHPVDFRTRSSLATATFDGDLNVLVQALRGVGVENVVICDLSDPAIGIAVVKVIVPLMENSYPATPGTRVAAFKKRQSAS